MKVVVFSPVIALSFSTYLKFRMSLVFFTVSSRVFHSTSPLKLKIFLSNSDLSLVTYSLSFLYGDIMK